MSSKKKKDQEPRPIDPHKIFVKRLPSSVSDTGLRRFFEKRVGEIASAWVAVDRDTLETRGFGWVVFAKQKHAQQAAEQKWFMKGSMLEIRADGDNGENDPEEDPRCKLRIGRLPREANDESLFLHFATEENTVATARVIVDRGTGETRGFGFVTFVSKSGAEVALKQQHFLQGKMLDIKRSTENAGSESPGHKVFVRSVPKDFNDEMLYHYVTKNIGKIERAQVSTDFQSGESRGSGFIIFAKDPKKDPKASKAFRRGHFINGRALEFGFEGEDRSDDNSTLIVKGLPLTFQDEELYKFFVGKCGNCVKTSRICMSRETGESRGFGFVVFLTKEDAEKAARATHYINKRLLHVVLKGDREPDAAKKEDSACKLFVGGLPWDLEDEELFDYFVAKFSKKVISARLAVDRESQTSRGFGYVAFADEATAKIAAKGPHYFRRRELNVRPESQKGGKGKGGKGKEDSKGGKGKEDNKEERARTLNIYGLPPEVTDEDLYEYFISKGAQVESARVRLRRETDESTGQGIVRVSSAQTAALLTKQTHCFGGRNLHAESDCDLERRLFVRGLDYELEDDGLYKYFTNCIGPVQSARIVVDDFGESRGIGIVVMVHPSNVQDALDMVHRLNGCPIQVRLDGDRDKGKGKGKDKAEDTAQVTEDGKVIEKEADNLTPECKAEELHFDSPEQALVAQETLLALQLSSVEVHPEDACRLVVSGLPEGMDATELAELVATTEEAEQPSGEVAGDESENWEEDKPCDESRVADNGSEEWEEDAWEEEGTGVRADAEWAEEWSEEEAEDGTTVSSTEAPQKTVANKRKLLAQGSTEVEDSSKRPKRVADHAPKELLDDWIPMISKTSGDVYYYNSRTGDAKPLHWKPVQSERTGEIYFYNEKTGESRATSAL